MTARLALDELRSARARRENHMGEWLPEPIVTDPGEDPAARAKMADSLSLACLVVLESVSPDQRAAPLLRDVFDYGHDEIAALIGTSEATPASSPHGHAARSRSGGRALRPRASSARSWQSASSRLPIRAIWVPGGAVGPIRGAAR